jgi:hypothetical protein
MDYPQSSSGVFPKGAAIIQTNKGGHDVAVP